MAFQAGALTARASIDTKKWRRGLKQMSSSVRTMSTKTKAAFGVAGKAIKIITSPLRLVVNLSKKAISFAGSVAKKAAIPMAGLAAGMGVAIKRADEYHRSLGNVNSLLVGSSMKMENLSAAVLRMNPALGSSKELMDSMYGAISAGADTTEKAIAMVKSAATLSGAILIENATAVDVLTTSVTAFKRSGMTAQRAADVLTTVIRLGKTTGRELASSFGRAAGLFANMGLSMEELGSATALMTQTVETSEAITQLRALMNSFSAPTVAMKRALKSAGFESGSMLLKTKGLAGAFRFLKEESGGSAEGLKLLLGSQEAVNGATSILNEGIEKLIETIGAMNGASGAADKALGKQRRIFQTLKNAISGTATEIGTLLLPMADLIAIDVTDKLQGFRDFIKSSDGLDAVAGVVERIAVGVFALYSAIQSASGVVLDQLSQKLLGMGRAVDGLGKNSGIAYIMINAVATAMGFVVAISSTLELMFQKMSARQDRNDKKAEIAAKLEADLAAEERSVATLKERTGVRSAEELAPLKAAKLRDLAIADQEVERLRRRKDPGLAEAEAKFKKIEKENSQLRAELEESRRLDQELVERQDSLREIAKTQTQAAEDEFKEIKKTKINRETFINTFSEIRKDIQEEAFEGLRGLRGFYEEFVGRYTGTLTGVGPGTSDGEGPGASDGEENNAPVAPLGRQIEGTQESPDTRFKIDSSFVPERERENTRSKELKSIRKHYDYLALLNQNNSTRTKQIEERMHEDLKEARERFRSDYVDKVNSSIAGIQVGYSVASSALTSFTQLANAELEIQMNQIDLKRRDEIVKIRANYAEKKKLAKGDKVALKKILEEQKADEAKVNEKYQTKEDEIRKKHFESTKALRISEVIMSTGQAIMGAWQASAPLGPIGGPIAAAALTFIILAASKKRLDLIKEQEYVASRAIGGMASGLTRVNERGGEIITLPDNSQVIPNDISRQIARNVSKTEPIIVNVNLDGAVFSSDIDIEEIGDVVAEVLKTRKVGM